MERARDREELTPCHRKPYDNHVLNIIDRYITRFFLGYFGAALVVLTTLFLAVDFLSNAGGLSGSAGALQKYYLYYLPFISYQMLPVACMIAAVFTLSQLNRANEVVALYSIGMGLVRICMPILVAVALISTFAFFLSDRLFPAFARAKNYIYYVELKQQPHLYSTVKTNRIWYRSQNILFNIKTINPEKHSAQGLSLYYFSPRWDLIQIVTAKTVNFNGRQWELFDGSVTLFAEETSFPLTQIFSQKVITMGEDVGDLTTTTHSMDVLSVADLRTFIGKHKEAGLETVRYEVDYHAKFAFAFAALVMTLVGIPFSVGNRRAGGVTRNVGLSVGLAFLYWAIYASGLTLGQHGVVYPVLGAWGPNFLMGGLALALMIRTR